MRQKSETLGGPDPAEVKSLRIFTNKHSPTITKCGMAALDLFTDPARCLRFVFVIDLYPRPESRRAETAFYVFDAYVAPFTIFDEGEAEMCKLLQDANEGAKRKGWALIGCFFVLLRAFNEARNLSNVAPVSFSKDHLAQARLQLGGEAWKDVLMRMFNEGIVV